MKGIHLIAAAVTIIVCAAEMDAQNHDWAKFGRYTKANAEVQVTPKAVFMGDSITDNWDDRDGSFFTDNNFACRGISGQTTSEMLVRFRPDVIELHPKYVVIMAGTNDLALNNGYIEMKNILGNIISMCELAKANRIKPILCSVLPSTSFGWRPAVGNPSEKIIELNAMIREYAKSAKIPYVDYHSALKDSSNGLPKKYAPDNVHPNKDAYRIMEGIVLKYL
ncbi:MAG: SGNH/GDSL hydrolase family protein [Clostridium sp.]|nr:SGNH/GDSL hydrolase family protein [Bacteroides sp.]MCM1198082.1 SGNH/GDSL hydrolase family protein [Clostridium sp.]